MIVRPPDLLPQIRVNISSLPPKLALVVKKIHAVDGEPTHSCKDIAEELGIGDDGQAVKSVMWMHSCALEQLHSKVEPKCTEDEKKNLTKALDSLSPLEQQVVYSRYGLSDGCPLTFRKMSVLFYPDLSGRKQTAIQKHTAKAQAKLAQMTNMTALQIDLILMSMAGELPEKEFPVQSHDTYLRRDGLTKLTSLRDLLSCLDDNQRGDFLVTLTPNMRDVFFLVIENPEDTAANLARKLQKPNQTLKNAKTVLDTQLNSIQKRLEEWIELEFYSEDKPQTVFSDDLISDIRELLEDVPTDEIASILEKLTPYQRDIFNLFLRPPEDTASATVPTTNGANTTKHISLENQTLYLRLKKLMHKNAKEINPPNALRALKRKIVRILGNRSLKASQSSPQLETLRLLIQDDPSILERLDVLDVEIIKLRLGREEQEPLTNMEIAQILSKVKDEDINTNFVERRVANVYFTLGIPSERVVTTKGKPGHSKKLDELQMRIQANPGILEECSPLERQIIDHKSGRDGKPRLTNPQIAEELTRLGNSADVSLIERQLTALYRRFGIS